MTPPTGFNIISGNDMPFVLYRGQTVRRVFQISIPANSVGTFTFDMACKVGSDEYRRTSYMTIQY
jgi:hypothetical protein